MDHYNIHGQMYYKAVCNFFSLWLGSTLQWYHLSISTISPILVFCTVPPRPTYSSILQLASLPCFGLMITISHVIFHLLGWIRAICNILFYHVQSIMNDNQSFHLLHWLTSTTNVFHKLDWDWITTMSSVFSFTILYTGRLQYTVVCSFRLNDCTVISFRSL